MIVFEDVQWADRATLDLVGLLVSGRAQRLLVVFTVRSDELHRSHPFRRMAARWEQQRLTERLELERLDAPAVAAQIEAILGERPDGELVEFVFERSEGIPLFVEELLGAVRAGGIQRDYLPPSLRDVLLARAENLSPNAHHLLRVASAASGWVPERLLALVARLPEAELFPALRETVEPAASRRRPLGAGVRVPSCPRQGGRSTRICCRVSAASCTRLCPGAGGQPRSRRKRDRCAHRTRPSLARCPRSARALAASIQAGNAVDGGGRAVGGAAPLRAGARAVGTGARCRGGGWASTMPSCSRTLPWPPPRRARPIGRWRSSSSHRPSSAPRPAPSGRRAPGAARSSVCSRSAARRRASPSMEQVLSGCCPSSCPSHAAAHVLTSLARAHAAPGPTRAAPGSSPGARWLPREAAGAVEDQLDAQMTLGHSLVYAGDVERGLALTVQTRDAARTPAYPLVAARACINLSDLLLMLGRYDAGGRRPPTKGWWWPSGRESPARSAPS